MGGDKIMNVFSLIPGQADNQRRPNGLDVLLRRLQLAHREADQPTYSMIGKQIGMSAATICRIFNAKKPPAWDKLRAVLEVLGIPDEEISTTWIDLWRGAENACQPIPVRLDAGLTVPGAEHCETCGAWLANTRIHADLHQRIEQLELLVQHLTAEM